MKCIEVFSPISPTFSNSSLLLCSTLVMWVARLCCRSYSTQQGAAAPEHTEQQGPSSGCLYVYPHTPSELWAWKLCTDPNPDFCRISHCSVFSVKPFFPHFKLAFSPDQAAAVSLFGRRQCGMVWLRPFAVCSLLLICFWVLATKSLHSTED